MFKYKNIVFLLLVVAFFSCDKEVYKKPKNLISEKEMVDIMVDLHIAEATYHKFRYTKDNWISEVSSASFYHSILDKYKVSQSNFEESYLYYVSRPKKYNKLYSAVTDKLNAKEESYNSKKHDLEDKSKK